MKILIENSKEKLKNLEDLKVLTEKQGEVIFEEKLDKMDDLLEKKSNLMREVDKLDKEFLIKYEDLKKEENISSLEELDESRYPELKDLKKVVEAITKKLQEIYEIDQVNTKELNKQFESIKAELKHIKGGKIARKGYGQQSSGSILIDEKK